MFATTSEIEQYIRMTLKQWSMSHIPVIIKDNLNHSTALGLYHCDDKKIEISSIALQSFHLFRFVLLHELCHALDHNERGSLIVNNRANFHGKNFHKWCKKLNIPSRRFIPKNLLV